MRKFGFFVVCVCVVAVFLCGTTAISRDYIGGPYQHYQESKCKSAQASRKTRTITDPSTPVPGRQMRIISTETYNWPDDSCVACGCTEESCAHTCSTSTMQGPCAYTVTTITDVEIHQDGLHMITLDGPTTYPPVITKTSTSPPRKFVISPKCIMPGKCLRVMDIGAFSISLAHIGRIPCRAAARGNTPTPSKSEASVPIGMSPARPRARPQPPGRFHKSA